MNEISTADSYQAAADRLERAVARLETGVRSLGERALSMTALENEARHLASDRSRLATELEQTRERMETLDVSAEEVARRLVDTIETVRSVLAK